MNVIIIGRNYSSLLGMIRGAGMADCSVTVVRIVRKITKKKENDRFSVIRPSKYVREQVFAEQNEESLMKVLLTKCADKNEKQVLLPTDDFGASTIDRNYDVLKEFFIMPNINQTQGEVVRLMDKNIQKTLADKVGLNVAKGWIVDIRDGKYSIPEGIEYPVFTKPQISILFNKNCMKRCDNEAELTEVVADVASKADCPILVEQYIEIETEYGILGASDGTTSIIPGIVTKKSIGHGAHNGVTLLGSYTSLKPFGDLKEKLQAFMKEVQFKGLFDIDLYEANGKVYFNELNLRLGAFGFAAVRAGFNLPGMVIDCLAKDIPIKDEHFEGSITCINEKVNLEDYAAGFISWKKYRENMKAADYGFINFKEDHGPYNVFRGFVTKARIQNLIKKGNKTKKETVQKKETGQNKLNVIVVTKTYSTTLGIVRSLGKAGYNIDLIYAEGRPGVSKVVSCSKYVNRTIVIHGRKDDEIIDTILREYSAEKEKYFIFPIDDYAASVIDRNLDKLEGFYYPYAGNKEQGKITELMDKDVQAEIAKECGFPVAKEWVVGLSDAVIPEDMVYPCFVKPLVSAQGYKKEIGACDSREALQNKLKELQAAKADRSVLIQEFLPITQEYSMSGLCLDQEIILPAIVKKLNVAQNERGVTLCGELVENEMIEPALDPLFNTLRRMHYTGMFDMEVFCVGDKIYFNEINLRSGGPNYSYYASGVNLPDILIKAVAGEEYDASPEITLHKTFLYEKAAWEDVNKGYMKKEEMEELYRTVDILLLDDPDDPAPGAEFREYITSGNKIKVRTVVKKAASKIKRTAKKIMKRASKRKA